MTHRDMNYFAAPDKIEELIERTKAVVGDRRMVVTSRYLDVGGSNHTEVKTAQIIDRSAASPVEVWDRVNRGIAFRLTHATTGQGLGSFGFSTDRAKDQAEARAIYHGGGRQEVTLVKINGWAHEHGHEDHIVIERWNQYGVGHETVIAFDDTDPVQELAKKAGREGGQGMLDRSWCTLHDQHYEDPLHEWDRECHREPSTLVQDLRMLTDLAEAQEVKNRTLRSR